MLSEIYFKIIVRERYRWTEIGSECLLLKWVDEYFFPTLEFFHNKH